MRDQLLRLTELQHLDDHLRTIALEQQRLPQQLQPYETACHEARQQLIALQTEIEQTTRQQRTLERELDEQQGVLLKIQVKAREVKTNKEYSAMLAEVAAGQQRLGALEDQVLHLMELLDQRRQAYKRQEQGVHNAEHALAEHSRQIQQLHEALNQDAALEHEKRQQTVAHLDAKLYVTYEKLSTLYHGRAVAQLHQGVCSGCHLKVQPQLVANIRAQEQLFTCPHCRLLLLWPADM